MQQEERAGELGVRVKQGRVQMFSMLTFMKAKAKFGQARR